MLKRTTIRRIIAGFASLILLTVLALPATSQAATSLGLISPGLSSTVQNGPQVSLQWTFASNLRINGYEVERSLEPLSGFVKMMTSASKDQSAIDSTVEHGNGYYYRVRAYKNGKTTDYSEFSNVVFADVPPIVIPPDSTPPTVSLTSPASGTQVTTAQTLTVTASTQDNVGVSKVEFYDGSALKTTDTSAPYSYAWAVTAADNGSHNLTAKAFDALGNVATSAAVSVAVNIATQTPTPGAFEFSLSDYAVNEGAGSVAITIQRVGGSDGVATVDWMTQGVTATFAQDYGNFSWTTLTFAHGETQKTGTISIVDDTLIEGDEIFNVLLANPTGGATLGAITTTAVTIKDNDQALPVPGAFEFSLPDYAVNEGAGSVAITIKRVGGSDGVVTVDWMTKGVTATFAQDYGNFSWTTLVFAHGETSKTEMVSIVDDTLAEGDEIFNVLLANPSGGATLGAVTTSAVTIKDNDQIQSGSAVFYGYNKSVGASDNPGSAPYGGVARYVSPINGANTGSGSIGQPWATLEYAMKNCTAGDTIYLRGGVHSYAIIINNNVPATQTKPVEVRSYPGEWAIIDGSNTNNGNLFRLYNESWLILRNFEIRNSDNSRISAGLALEGSKDCEFHNLYIHSNHGSGVAGAVGTERLKFYNLTVENNYDVSANGENADGFAFTAGLNHEFYRCVAGNNSDDGWDLWSSSGHYFEDCISHSNGYGSAGDGNGFKLGKVASSTPQAGIGGGKHTLVRCRAVGNKTRGFDENGSTVANTFEGNIAYNSGMNWKIPNASHAVYRGVSFAGTGDSIGNSSNVTASKGQGFGGYVSASDFESVNLADMNNPTVGKRFFVPVSQTFWP